MNEGNGELRGLAEGLAQYGRGGDTALMHVNPIEVAEINRLFPGSITRNPHTGQPEAFFWILPAILSSVTGLGGAGAGGISSMITGALGEGVIGSTLAAPTTAVAGGLNSLSAALGAEGLAGAVSMGEGIGSVGSLPGGTIPGAYVAPEVGAEVGAGAGAGGAAAEVVPEITAETIAEGAAADAGIEGAVETGIAESVEATIPEIIGEFITEGATNLGEFAASPATGPVDLVSGGLESLSSGLSNIQNALQGTAPVEAAVPAGGNPMLPAVDKAVIQSAADTAAQEGLVPMADAAKGLELAPPPPGQGFDQYAALDAGMDTLAESVERYGAESAANFEKSFIDGIDGLGEGIKSIKPQWGDAASAGENAARTGAEVATEEGGSWLSDAVNDIWGEAGEGIGEEAQTLLSESENPLMDYGKAASDYSVEGAERFGTGLQGEWGRAKLMGEGLGRSVAASPELYGGGIFMAEKLWGGGDGYDPTDVDWGDTDWSTPPAWSTHVGSGGPPIGSNIRDIIDMEWDF